ncbi:uncharacterized protein M421DRAFT_422614 [Didymella exigua CBS 183.55]|uniref:Uncharacterized protein n=1 Tax=Didymella exigua CBS 183.55 TaxID=1150837 RepID=A0A6A5RGL2_9PLEO|nr:uncharacterized protein M421DRAFT_422614 [Didymella exigua CBS 183.55]KAF1926649.1 hypothetical protein M421DRAFT_422614 [Didymella exigua CBS 183.55]
MAACTEYRRGVAAEWTGDRLLAIVAKWSALDREEGSRIRNRESNNNESTVSPPVTNNLRSVGTG